MSQIPDLQSTNTLGSDDQVLLRQGSIDKRISLELAATLTWAKREGYSYIGEHTLGIQYPNSTSFTVFLGRAYFVKPNVPLPYTSTTSSPSIDTNLYVMERGEEVVIVSTAGQSPTVGSLRQNQCFINSADGVLYLNDGTKIITLATYLVGEIKFWGGSTPPTGYLELAGQTDAELRAMGYNRLADLYQSAGLPDARGEAIRGLDSGRGVDAGRAVNSSQGDAMRNITGSSPFPVMTTDPSGSGEAGAIRMQHNSFNISAPQGSTIAKDLDFDASRVVPTSNEFRMRNIALMVIIRHD